MIRGSRSLAVGTGALLALACLVPAPSARAESRKYGELLKRVPDQANVLMVVDVEGLLDSPLGKSEQWREKAASQGGGLGLADDLSRFAVGASYDLHSLHENWKIGVGLLTGDLPDLEKIARREGGYVETLQNVPVVWTPRGFNLIAFPPRTIGYIEQADRQAIGRWLQSSLLRPRAFPGGYADRALVRADAGSQIVLALNLNEAVSAKSAEPWLHSVESLQKGNFDFGALARQLADAQSAFLQIDVKEGITGTLRIEFKNKIDYLAPLMKDIVLTALDDYGAMLPELSSWTLRIDPNKQAIELSGRMGTESARRILSLARPPQTSTSRESFADAPPAADGKPAEAKPDDIVKASQRYFHSVIDLMNGLKGVDRPTYSSQKLWYDRYAKQVEELPILGVDSDLLDWGSAISRTLREMAHGINYADKDAAYRLAGTANGYGGFAYGGYGYYYANSKGYDAAVLKKQTNAAVSVQLDARWETMQASIADMRRKMTEKYKVEF